MTVTLLHGDARAIPLADDTVDLIVTSPPYWALRSYQDGGEHYADQIGAEGTPQEYLDALLAVTAECARVLKPSGSLFVNLGDKYSDRAGPEWGGSSDGLAGRPAKPRRQSGTSMAPRRSLMGLPWRYALRAIDDLGLVLREDVIWSKPNGMPESVTNRCRRQHEYIFHFTLSGEDYYADMDGVREPSQPDHKKRSVVHTNIRHAAGQAPVTIDRTMRNPNGRLPSSVWVVPTEPLNVPEHLGADHYAAFPTELPWRAITGWCPPGGTVLDPFGGTGTTALVATALDRHGISLDASADYGRIAEWRTTDPRQLAKAARRPYRPPPDVPEGQESLLDLLA